jgi:F0F1-type ATP synthase assembly protein I
MKKNKYIELLSYLTLVTHIGWIMSISILVGFLIGYFIYQKTELKIIFILFIIIGIIAGFYNVYKLIWRKINKDDENFDIP